jgi:hypothetical protein
MKGRERVDWIAGRQGRDMNRLVPNGIWSRQWPPAGSQQASNSNEEPSAYLVTDE